jgi:hypothetical protein
MNVYTTRNHSDLVRVLDWAFNAAHAHPVVLLGGIYCLYTQCEVALTVLHFLQVIYALTAIFSKRQLWNDWPGLQIATTAVCLVASMLLAINKCVGGYVRSKAVGINHLSSLTCYTGHRLPSRTFWES